MLLEAKNISDIAEKLNITKEDLLHDSVKIFLERKIKGIKDRYFLGHIEVWCSFG